MDFEQARAEYARLRQAYDGRQISAEEYGRRVQTLQVRDASGGYWAIDGNTGGWLRHDGSNWVPGQPPVPRAPLQAQPPSYSAPQQPQQNVGQPQQQGFNQQQQGGFNQQPQGGFAQQPQAGYAAVPQVGAVPAPARQKGGNRTVLIGCGVAGVLLLLFVVVAGILITRGSGGIVAAFGGGSGLTEAATARTLTNDKRPDEKSGSFTINQEMYITYTARSVKKGESVVLKLSRNGEPFGEPGGTTTPFDKDATYSGYYIFTPPQAGTYKAELFYNGEATPSQTLEFTAR